MLKRILTLTTNSFREMYRDRFFLILLFGVVGFFVLSLLLGELSFEEHQKILFDLGISAIHWLNLGLCLFIGGGSLRKELDRQTYMTILSSPLTRAEMLLGKYGGILLVAFTSTSLMGAVLWFLLDLALPVRNFIAVLVGIAFEAGVLLSMALLFSLIFSPFVGLFVSIGVFLMGHWLESLRHFAGFSKNDFYIQFSKGADWIFPNLYRLNWRSLAVLEEGIPVEVGSLSLLHAMAWIGIFMVAAHVLFQRKNLI